MAIQAWKYESMDRKQVWNYVSATALKKAVSKYTGMQVWKVCK